MNDKIVIVIVIAVIVFMTVVGLDKKSNRADLNQDGKVDMADVSILMSQMEK